MKTVTKLILKYSNIEKRYFFRRLQAIKGMNKRVVQAKDVINTMKKNEGG